MENFLQQVINGISLGSVYALIALGYTMVYGIIKLINFAHGDVYMLGAFFGFYAISVYGLPFVPALIVAMAGAAIIGVTIERLAYKPLRGAPRIAALMTAVGVSLFLENFGIYIFGARPRAFPRVITDTPYEFFGATIASTQIIIMVTTVILMVVLQLIVHHTRAGKAMRAVSFDRDAARLMGINVDSTISITFAIGSALAAAAGVLVGIYYNTINPLMGLLPGLKAFVAAVLGGIGSIPGAMLGGLLLGVAEAGVSAVGLSTYRDAVAFAILIIILLVKPAGIMGTNVREKV